MVLFFDGDSRGNPGPGGAGAALINTDPRVSNTSIFWAGSVSLASSTAANNYAEYLGLIWGLQVATKLAMSRLHVVGDSAVILNQMRHNKAPTSEKLRPLYARARLLTDHLGMLSWEHHYRVHRKMTGHLTNQAMDSKASAQDSFPSAHPQLIEVVTHLTNDITFWQLTRAEKYF